MHIGLGNFLFRLNQWRGGVLLMMIDYADVHANYCDNPRGAGKTIRDMEKSSNFAPEQIRQAKALLEEWR